MNHLEDIFRKNGQVYDGSAKMVIDLFYAAFTERDDETMKALIFPGSPVLSAVKDSFHKGTFLHYIAKGKETSIVILQLLIEFGININAQNADGQTALHIAVRIFGTEFEFDVAKVLLKSGADRNIRDKNGLTPIEVCLFYGLLQRAELFLKEKDQLPNMMEVDRTIRRRHLVKCLLQEKNDWNIPGTNYSILLHFLLLENDEETFEYVASNTKFDVNAFSFKKMTLLFQVAQRGTPRMIRALVNVGADLEAGNKEFLTPLIRALHYNKIENVHCLLDCGASINDVETTYHETNSPLHYAVCMQNLEIVEKLVKKGANVNALTYHRSPLLLACGSIYSVKWHRCNVFGLVSVFYAPDPTLQNLHDTTFNIKIVEFLLDHGADIEAKNISNRTALDQACRLGKLDIVKLLLSRGAKINQGDVSTLHHAVRGENPAIAKLILEQGANVDYRCAPEKIWDDPDYESPPPRTPLECALNFIRQDSNCKDIVELLMEYGVNVNVADPVQKESPLHLACLSNKTNNFIIKNSISRPETIKLLLRHKANVNALDSNGLTPLHYALRNYTLLKSSNTTRNSFNHIKSDLVTLIAFIAKKIDKKEYVIEEYLVLLEDESFRPIYQECVNELSLIKKNICESRNFSFYNILYNDIQCLGGALKNEDIYQIVNSGEYKKQFRIYLEYLEDRISEATNRQYHVDLAIALFQKHVNKNTSVELIVNILKFLSLDDFKNFAKACFVDVE